jgi:peptidoglycan/LPS O-acetylase OafA/YrhL
MRFTQEPKLKISEKSTRNHIQLLTPLRGIAALFIVAFHYLGMLKAAEPEYNLKPQFLELLILKSYLWVDFFFILSGFVIFHVYHTKFSERLNKHNYQKFLIARFARIYPLHLVTLLLLLILQLPIYLVEPKYAFSEEYFPWIGLLTNIALLGSIGNISSGWNDVSWAVGAEWYTYMIFPFLVPLFLRNSPPRIFLNFLLPIALLFGLSTLSTRMPGTLLLQSDYGLFRCLLDFTLGIGIYQIYQKGWFRLFLSRDYTFLLAWIWIITVVLTGGHDVWTIPGFILLIISAALNNGKTSKILNIKGLVFLGEISYCIYLVHGVLRILTYMFSYIFCGEYFCPSFTQMQLYLGLFGFIVITIIFSIVAYYAIEVKARKYLLEKLLRL